jgi:hypothetical protein
LLQNDGGLVALDRNRQRLGPTHVDANQPIAHDAMISPSSGVLRH